MPNTAKVNFNITQFTNGISTPLNTIVYAIGITKRGPVEQPELPVSLINNWSQFEKTFGGLLTTSDFPLLCKRALSRGVKLRVCRVDATSVAAAKASAKNIANGDGTPVTMFSVQPKYKGADCNYISIQITAASNGNANYWNMYIVHSVEPALNETYINIPAFNKSTASNQTNLDEIKQMSALLDFTYADCSSATLLVPAVAAASFFSGGADPSGFADADYTGAMSAFDAVDDGIALAVPEMDSDGINAAGAAYAAARQDLIFLAHLPNSITTAANLVTERTTIASNTKYFGLFGGGLRIRDSVTLQEKSISEMGDVMGLVGYIHDNFGQWFSLAGQNKGSIPDCLGVVNNFGTPAKFDDLNTLANAQINMVVVKNSIPQLSGNFSGQFANNQEKFLSTVFFTIWLKKVLKPVFEGYLEEPNDPITFRQIYYHVKPFLDKLKSPAQRAIYEYDYQGDQDAQSLDELQINNAVDVQNGKYKVQLKLWLIPSLQELTINIMLVQGEGITIQ